MQLHEQMQFCESKLLTVALFTCFMPFFVTAAVGIVGVNFIWIFFILVCTVQYFQLDGIIKVNCHLSNSLLFFNPYRILYNIECGAC